jgi:DNA-binding response OmpR family regulator
MHALVVAQEPDELAILSVVLQRAGMTVSRTGMFERTIQTGPEHPTDFVILAAKESPSPAQIRRFRAQTQVPLVVIVGHVDEDVHIELLEAGVDLIVSRPFSARLLIGQVRALIRRAASVPFFSLPVLTMGELTLDPATRTVRVSENSPQRLTHLEFRLLYTLMLNQGQILSAETLVEHVWGYTGEGDRNLVRGLVRRLRSKVEPDPGNPRYVVTVTGLGYTFEPMS